MKSIYFLFLISILSCKKKELQKPFIVSELNRKWEKHFEEEKKKDPDVLLIENLQPFDYPKEKLNFIFTKKDKIYYYQENIINEFCGTEIKPDFKIKRQLSTDSLHLIKYDDIKNILKSSVNKEDFKNNYKELHPISFIFEKDTISEYNIQQLLIQVDSLGFHRYNVRRIAPFEKKVIVNIK